MAIILPFTNDGDRSITVNVGDAVYGFETYYLPNKAIWAVDISDANGVLLLAGIGLIPGVDNLLKGQGALFNGVKMVMQGDNSTPDSLGTTAQVLWFPNGDTSGNFIAAPDIMIL